MAYNLTMEFEGLDGKNYTFKSMKNPLTSSQMYWIDPLNHMFAGTVHDAKTMAKDIRDSCKILSEENTCHRSGF